MQDGAPDVLMGYEIVTDPNMTAIGTAAGTSVAFGDWSGWYLRDVGIRFEMSRDFAFNQDITSDRVISGSTRGGSTSPASAASSNRPANSGGAGASRGARKGSAVRVCSP